MEIPIVALGNAIHKCPECQKDISINPNAKYMYEIIMRLQNSKEVIIRASYRKIPMYEAIMGSLAIFNLEEKERKTVVHNDKEMVEIKIFKR